MLCVLFFCVICEKKNIGELSWGVPSFTKDISFSHRTHRFNRTFLRTVSIPQNASGIQNSQSVSAIIITNKGHNEAYILFYRGISVITPLPFGEGMGGGAIIFLAFVCSVHLCFSVRKKSLHKLKLNAL